MQWFRDLPPAQRTALMVGVPIVALVVIIQLIRRPAPEPVETDTGPTASGPSGTTAAGPPIGSGAIGVGELTDMVGTLTDKLIDIHLAIDAGEKGTTPTPPKPTPAPVPSVIVRNGETWAQLTRRVYGTSNWWMLIRDHPNNQPYVVKQPDPQKAAPAGARIYTPPRPA